MEEHKLKDQKTTQLNIYIRCVLLLYLLPPTQHRAQEDSFTEPLPQLESLKLYAKGKEKSKLSILSQKG
jgi:hypothetical protein